MQRASTTEAVVRMVVRKTPVTKFSKFNAITPHLELARYRTAVGTAV